MTAGGDLFARRTLGWLLALGGTSLVLGFVINIFSTDLFEEHSAGTDTYSRSAVGHHALLELLREYDVPVRVTRHAGVRPVENQVLLLLEPRILIGWGGEFEDRLEQLLDRHPLILIALPKWKPFAWPGGDAVEQVELRTEYRVESLLGAVGLEGCHIVRPVAALGDWQVHGAALDLTPQFEQPQLISGNGLTPIISCDEGILVGEFEYEGALVDARVLVISDPDLLSNHGIGRGDNAAVLLGLLRDELLGDRTRLVIDENIHGYGQQFSLWRELFRPPVLFVTLQLLMTMLMGVWLGMGRFGAPVPAREHLDAGKAMLIANTSRLLRYGGHYAHSLRRYLQAAKREVAACLHAPADLGVDELTPWLARVGRHHGIESDIERLESEVRSATIRDRGGEIGVLSTARRVHRWKQELLNAAAGHPERQ